MFSSGQRYCTLLWRVVALSSQGCYCVLEFQTSLMMMPGVVGLPSVNIYSLHHTSHGASLPPRANSIVHLEVKARGCYSYLSQQEKSKEPKQVWAINSRSNSQSSIRRLSLTQSLKHYNMVETLAGFKWNTFTWLPRHHRVHTGAKMINKASERRKRDTKLQ